MKSTIFIIICIIAIVLPIVIGFIYSVELGIFVAFLTGCMVTFLEKNFFKK